MSETTPENENPVADNSINEPTTPGQERNAEDGTGGIVDAAATAGAAPLAEPQGSAVPEVQGALDQVQATQNVADQQGHFGHRADPRPLEDYSVEGSVARAEAGDTAALPQASE